MTRALLAVVVTTVCAATALAAVWAALTTEL